MPKNYVEHDHPQIALGKGIRSQLNINARST
jgi:hypothetical protein